MQLGNPAETAGIAAIACRRATTPAIEPGARLHGLNLMALQNHRVAHPVPHLDTLLGFHTLATLFPVGARQQNLRNLIETEQYITTTEIDERDFNQWSDNYLDADHVLHTSAH